MEILKNIFGIFLLLFFAMGLLGLLLKAIDIDLFADRKSKNFSDKIIDDDNERDYETRFSIKVKKKKK